MQRYTWFLVLCAVGALAPPAASGATTARVGKTSVSVTGAAAAPATYTTEQLAALPQTTVQTTRSTPFGPITHTDRGVSLQALVELAQPALPGPPVKNPSLRVTIGVSGNGQPATLALGELHPDFGNHPAVLVLSRDDVDVHGQPWLVVPGDTNDRRTVLRVRNITIGVQSPTATPPAHPGDLAVSDGRRTKVLSAQRLAKLPSETRTVTFLQGTTPQTRTEIGPALSTVLSAAGLKPGLDSWVAAVAASDGYTATVTPGEDSVGGRPLMVSLNENGVALTQPRLVTDGDVKGGRYVSGVTDLFVGRGSR